MVSQIGQYRFLCLEVSLVTLTATSGASFRRKFIKMCFPAGCEVITESPDRRNITISSLQIPNNDNIEATLMWLLDEFKQMKEKLPRHIFCKTISNF